MKLLDILIGYGIGITVFVLGDLVLMLLQATFSYSILQFNLSLSFLGLKIAVIAFLALLVAYIIIDYVPNIIESENGA